MSEKDREKNKYNISEEFFKDGEKSEAALERQRKRDEERNRQAQKKDPVLLAKRARKARIIGFIVFVLLFVVLIFGKSLYNGFKLKGELDAKEEELRQKQEELAEKEDEYENVTSDEYVENEARSHLHMIKDGEKMYIIKDEEEEGEE